MNTNIDCVGIYLKEIKDGPLLTAEEEIQLGSEIANGSKEAKKKMVESNLCLVVSIAKGYIGKGVCFEDLIQEGNLGLVKATEKYDVNKGVKFSTYATWWIKESIKRAIINQYRLIHIPSKQYHKVRAYIKTTQNLEQELQRDPTILEIANKMNESIDEVELLRQLEMDIVSLNALLDYNIDLEVADLTSTEESILEERFLYNQIMEILKKIPLKPREIDILIHRFGLYDKNEMTLEEIGRKYGFTREWIRRIEKRALKKVRESKYLYLLEEYILASGEAPKIKKKF